MGFFDKLKKGLEKSKISLGFNKVDEEVLETLEELIMERGTVLFSSVL